MANALEMKDICIGFSGVQVLKNVSLTVLRRDGTRSCRRKWSGKIDPD
ncbi:MAG: hypothetical protein ACLUFI_15265 [Oscillospiraceae bacterium]